MSTREYQDPASSLGWQRHSAEALIAGRGEIVLEYFDVGYTRRLGWSRRPRSAALLEAIADPNRAFDAIVVGEAERAFYRDQLIDLIPLLRQHGIGMWLPDTFGPVDFDNPVHLAVITQLGGQSRREVERSRFRTTAAMSAQVRTQGRYLGGRPPYGYRLVDAGPHPNTAHARWGRRLQQLDPDPLTAPHVTWMFQHRLAGWSLAAVTRALNDAGVPSPAAADPDRNAHRAGTKWILRTVALILANPRYTGRQVWNRQAAARTETGGESADGADTRCWNPSESWIVSQRIAHPPLVSEADFIAVQAVRVVPNQTGRNARTYLLSGLVICALCGRRMTAHWGGNRPAYRCRHGHNSAQRSGPDHQRNLYVRKDVIVDTVRVILPGLVKHRPDEVASYLRRHARTITCDRGAVALTAPSSSDNEEAEQVTLPGL
ncbi:recombinase family protein [Longispora urticae]